MLILNVRCKRCGGNLYIDRELEGDAIKCLACGFERDIPANSEEIKQEVIKVESFDKLKSQKDAIVAKQEGKTKGQLFYEKHAAETGIKTQWKDFGQTQKDRYERKAAGTWTRKQSVKKPLKPVAKPVGNMPDSTKTDTKKENIMPKYTCPYCEVGWSQADALIQHMTVCHFEVAKPETKPEPQEELLRFTCVMRASTASKLITLGIKYLGDIGAFPDSKIELLKQVPHV